jgi:hypothetical protein
MSRRVSTLSSSVLGAVRATFAAWTIGATLLLPRIALGQACCAGASAITPGRLALHEQGLLGGQLRAAWMLGSFNRAARFAGSPPGTSEWDFEQDLFGSLRFARRAQLSLLVPVLESRRRTPSTGAEFGAGLGDLNLSARYDFTWAREYRALPGIAALLGVTFPTGRPPESAHLALGSDATGLGAVQLSAGLALERTFGDWLVDVSGLVAKRLNRRSNGVDSELGTQFTGIVAVGYSFPGELAAALVGTYSFEGNASVAGSEVADTAKRQLRLAGAIGATLTDTVRMQGSLFVDPPLAGVGRNSIASSGLTLTLIRSFL